MRFEGVDSNLVVKVLCNQLSDPCVHESHAVQVMTFQYASVNTGSL